MLFPVLIKKAYQRNMQYRASHIINTAASAAFGLIYVSIWKGIGQPAGGDGYTLDNVIHYVAFNQVCLWITLFITNGLGIERSVRTGQISLDLMRPVHLFYHLMCREWGQIGYQLLYKSLPIYILYIITLHLPVPTSAVTWLGTAAALTMAAYMNICINYLIGVTALWTTESNWLFWVHNAISTVLSGFLIPVDWLPGWLQTVSRLSFYPYMQYFPSKIYLGLTQASAVLSVSLLWCILLTALCLAATSVVRKKLEVQGG
ncbi:ABC transporter permease [Paenibacillus sp. TAB 01]|uniref:ABC transporter permease n=1 Tax=Paenibacillus sp. TAB 01 TaxID=3368988 RepID=UPI003752664A